MNSPDVYLDSCKDLIKTSYLKNAIDNSKAIGSRIRTLLRERKWPRDGWSDVAIETILSDIASLDTNNFSLKAGVGEREGRVYSKLVARRNLHLAHGIGRSGDLTEVQPKAVGSSIMSAVCNGMVLDLLKTRVSKHVKDAFVMPVATGMSLTLMMLTLKKSRPDSKYVIWPRTDQKSFFKSISTAGLIPIVIELENFGDERRVSEQAVQNAIEQYGSSNIVCVLTTASAFCPRGIDPIAQISRICEAKEVPHICNNAFGLQSQKIVRSLESCYHHGRLDGFVQSTDKNLMVPVGGCIVAGFNGEYMDAIKKNYPGRASAAVTMDVFITLLSMGKRGYTDLLITRENVLNHLTSRWEHLAHRYNERLLNVSSNEISMGMTLNKLQGHLENKSPPRHVTELGGMLFTRNVTGARVVSPKSTKTIEGYSFNHWGTHSNSSCQDCYLTFSVSIGATVFEIDYALKKLDSCLTELYR